MSKHIYNNQIEIRTWSQNGGNTFCFSYSDAIRPWQGKVLHVEGGYGSEDAALKAAYAKANDLPIAVSDRIDFDQIRGKARAREYEPKSEHVQHPGKLHSPTDSEIVEYMRSEEGQHKTLANASAVVSRRKQKEYGEKLQAYENWESENALCDAQFVSDLLEASELWDYENGCRHPMFSPIYDIAYDQGHSAGREEITTVFETALEAFWPVIRDYEFVERSPAPADDKAVDHDEPEEECHV